MEKNVMKQQDSMLYVILSEQWVLQAEKFREDFWLKLTANWVCAQLNALLSQRVLEKNPET